jgi:hypothetical protein
VLKISIVVFNKWRCSKVGDLGICRKTIFQNGIEILNLGDEEIWTVGDIRFTMNKFGDVSGG